MTGVSNPTELEREIARRLREKRLSLGITVKFLADKTGLVPQQIVHYEKANTRLSAAMLVEFARVLRVPPAELLPAA